MAWPFSKAMKIQEFLDLNPSTHAYELASPWSTSTAAMVAWSDFFNGYAEIVTRDVAVQVPGVSRAEKLLVGLADVPLVVERKQDAAMVQVDPQPTWTQRTDGPITPWHRMAYTIRDIYYDGWSLWLAQRGSAGQVLQAQHVSKHRIETNAAGTLKIDGRPMSAEEVIFIPGPGMGLLQEAAGTIRGAKAIEKAWIQRVQSPIPLVVLKETVENLKLSDDEIEAVKASWIDARGSLNGAVGYVPYGMDIDTHVGGDDSALFIEGRNALRLDVANFSNIPASLLDGSTATASLTYVTTEGQRSSFHEQSIRYWLAPIEHRLSQDDVVPAGQRVRFDVAFLDNTPQETTSD
jgi:hypothetical protein